jgi:hypothetical protein
MRRRGLPLRWRHGVVDGEREPRSRHDPPLTTIYNDGAAVAGTFPYRYLGLQCHNRPLQKIHAQPLIDKIRNRLA